MLAYTELCARNNTVYLHTGPAHMSRALQNASLSPKPIPQAAQVVQSSPFRSLISCGRSSSDAVTVLLESLFSSFLLTSSVCVPMLRYLLETLLGWRLGQGCMRGEVRGHVSPRRIHTSCETHCLVLKCARKIGI
jgi:hypothetical protein